MLKGIPHILSPDLLHALQSADRIGILQAGRLVEECDAHTLTHAELLGRYLAHGHAAAGRPPAGAAP